LLLADLDLLGFIGLNTVSIFAHRRVVCATSWAAYSGWSRFGLVDGVSSLGSTVFHYITVLLLQ